MVKVKSQVNIIYINLIIIFILMLSFLFISGIFHFNDGSFCCSGLKPPGYGICINYDCYKDYWCNDNNNERTPICCARWVNCSRYNKGYGDHIVGYYGNANEFVWEK